MGYPSALKFTSLAVLFLVAALIMPMLCEAPSLVARWVLLTSLLAIPGLLSLYVLSPADAISSAFGTYMVILCCLSFAAQRTKPQIFSRWPSPWLITLTCLGVLSVSGKRGPVLALLVGVAITALLDRRQRGKDVVAVVGIFSSGLLAAWLLLDKLQTISQHIPLIGQTLARALASGTVGTEAEANVALRKSIWKYCISEAFKHPLLGVGAGRPFALEFRGIDISARDIGPHNSFIGLAYYVGIPALMLFLILTIRAAHRLYKHRAQALARAQLGVLAASVVISFTNVALEAPYIAGPYVLFLTWSLACCNNWSQCAVVCELTGGSGS